MKNKAFDDWLKSKLEQYEDHAAKMDMHGMPSPDWQKFSRVLENNNKSHTVDLKVKNTLANAKIHSREANWEQFQLRLQLIRERRKKIITARIIELSLVMLIFWTLHTVAVQNLFNFPPINKPAISSPRSIQTNPAVAKESMMDEQESQLAQQSKREEPIASTHKTKTQIPLSSNTAKSLEMERKLLSNKFNSASNKNTRLALHSRQKFVPEDQNSFISAEPSPSVKAQDNIQNNIVPVEEKMYTVPDNQKWNDALHNASDSTQTEPSAESNTQSNSEGLLQAEMNKIQPLKQNESTSFIWFEMGSNFMHFRYHNSYNAPEYIQQYSGKFNAFNQSIHMFLNYPLWLIELGVDFYRMKYTTNKYLAFGKLKEGEIIDIIKGMNFKMLEIPFHLHYKVMDQSKFQLTAFAGMSLAICNSASYDVTSAITKKPLQLYYNPKEELTYIDVNYNNGIQNDHSFTNNTFTNYSLGLGANYSVSKHFKISSKLTYQNMIGLQGFGPLNERFQNYSIGLGLQYGL